MENLSSCALSVETENSAITVENICRSSKKLIGLPFDSANLPKTIHKRNQSRNTYIPTITAALIKNKQTGNISKTHHQMSGYVILFSNKDGQFLKHCCNNTDDLWGHQKWNKPGTGRQPLYNSLDKRPLSIKKSRESGKGTPGKRAAREWAFNGDRASGWDSNGALKIDSCRKMCKALPTELHTDKLSKEPVWSWRRFTTKSKDEPMICTGSVKLWWDSRKRKHLTGWGGCFLPTTEATRGGQEKQGTAWGRKHSCLRPPEPPGDHFSFS